MSALVLRPALECRYDAVSLGEVMLRLDPGEGRTRTARALGVWEGGGEYNVARGLRRCFGLRTAVVTALVDNEVGRLVEDLVLTGGVDTSLVRWVPFDGTGRAARNGLNFTERGLGVRGALGVSDRGHTAVSQMQPGDVDWDHLFGEVGVRLLHTGGVFAALSATTPEVALTAMRAARRHGTLVSYDCNFRPSLWRGEGGAERAREVTRALVQHADVVVGGEDDLVDRLGVAAPTAAEEPRGLGAAAFGLAAEAAAEEFPLLSVVATTRRVVRSASLNDWGAAAWSRATGVVEATRREGVEVLDRVGSGDAFAAGLLHGLLAGASLHRAVELGAAHGALVMTTPGDTSMATSAEVEALAAGTGARADR
ncbi:sugar kinase [Pseudokineococcus sp. 5B2Z-1]|uniref:sugar kinase n=1 Tax=Pseudokineococcus sp. 5B2Z-1 TaxID=3132744 RepID=UPI0030AD52F0